jgi:hypothetical protein
LGMLQHGGRKERGKDCHQRYNVGRQSEHERPFWAESSMLALPSIQVPMDKVQIKSSLVNGLSEELGKL